MKLSKEEAKDYINSHPEQYLQRDKSGKGFICPLCGNGSGSDGDGLRLNKRAGGAHYKCFKCGFYGDMIELIAKVQGIEGGSSEAFRAAREAYQIELDNVPRIKKQEEAKPMSNESKAVEAESVKDYLRRCRDSIAQGSDYLSKRGLNLAVAARYHIGYDIDKRAIVIPTLSAEGSLSYVLRYTSDAMRIRYQNAEGLSVGLFGIDAIGKRDPVFIVEGAFDALSIIQMGFGAIALNSGSNVDQLIRLISERKGGETFPSEFLIAMDNDEAGRGFIEKLSEGLEAASVPFQVVDISNGCKDANELLQANSEQLRANLNRAAYPDNARDVDAHKVSSLIPGFKAYITDSANNHSIPTGFSNFNKAIGGGLFPKLYVVGAKSSVGKTTFCLQIMDEVARGGNDVIIFSLEMSKEDIIARSLSRHTYQIAKERNNERLAKTELGIVAYERYTHYTSDDKATIAEAYKQYTQYANERISIYEGKHTAAEIREKVEAYIRFTGKKPVVMIDYLQIVQPSEKLRRATVREQVDDSVDAFAAMRRELKIPVIVISSFNRGSYNAVADNASFKESGTIEYSSDVTITLEIEKKKAKSSDQYGNKRTQTQIEDEGKENELEGMRQDVRKIKLTFQKNRGNRVGSEIHYLYDAKFNYFYEDENNPAIL